MGVLEIFVHAAGIVFGELWATKHRARRRTIQLLLVPIVSIVVAGVVDNATSVLVRAFVLVISALSKELEVSFQAWLLAYSFSWTL